MGSRFAAAADLTFWPALLASLALAGAPIARAAPAAASEVTAKERVAKGLEFYQAGNYDAAILEFKAAYAAAPSPTILFPWAQAERLRGNCREAIDLYQRFIDSGPPQKQVEAASQNRKECVERIESAESAAASLVPGETGDAPATSVEAPQAAPEGPPEPEPAPPPQKPRPDGLGWGLLGGGLGLAAIGAGLLGGAAAKQSQAAGAATYGEFAADKQGARALGLGGGVLTGIGLVLAIGGAIRLAIMKKRGGAAQAWFEPRGGLGFGGRF